jgi:cytochrome b
MVVLMLLLLMVQATTGLFATDDIAYQGPYYPAVNHDLAEWLTGIHHKNFNIILAAIVLHLCAIAYYTFVKKEPLVPAMFHGGKPAQHVPAHEVIAVAGGCVYWLLHAAPPPSVDID